MTFGTMGDSGNSGHSPWIPSCRGSCCQNPSRWWADALPCLGVLRNNLVNVCDNWDSPSFRFSFSHPLWLIKQTRDVLWAAHPKFWNTSFQLGEKQSVSSSAAPSSIPAFSQGFMGWTHPSSGTGSRPQTPEAASVQGEGTAAGAVWWTTLIPQPCSHFHSQSGCPQLADSSSCPAFPAGLTSSVLGRVFIPFGNAGKGFHSLWKRFQTVVKVLFQSNLPTLAPQSFPQALKNFQSFPVPSNLLEPYPPGSLPASFQQLCPQSPHCSLSRLRLKFSLASAFQQKNGHGHGYGYGYG